MFEPNNKRVTALVLIHTAFLTTIVAAAEEPVVVPVANSAAWLPVAGKSDEWRAATVRCRELLEKLHLPDALVEKHLPMLQEKAQLVLRSPDVDWKTRTAVDYLENILEDLSTGREPHSRYAGKEFAYPYWSKNMERIEAIWVHMPPEYDTARRYQFFLYYKCGGGIHLEDGRVTGGYRPTVEMANHTDSFHAWSSLNIQVKGRRGSHIELEEATEALCRDFSIDSDRIFLTGWSDGGFTAIWLASHYPHLVAGIAPACANWQYGNVENIGLSNLPTLAVDGWSDGGYNSSQFCRWLSLRGLGADAQCIWGHHGHSYQPYEDVDEFQFIMEWAKGKRRNSHPKRVRYSTWNLAWNRAYWVSIDRVENPALAAQFEAEVSDNNCIQMTTWNIAAYRLALNDKLVDPQQPVTVITNGEPSYSGPLKADLLVELSTRPAGKFVKDASLPDDIATAVIESAYDSQGSSSSVIPSRRWLAVEPTGCDEATAGLLATWLPPGAKADVDVREKDLAEYNLVLYGGPDINKLTARIAEDLPVKFERGKFALQNKVYDGPTHCIAFLHPNPMNPRKYVIVYAFNDAETFARHGFFGMTGGSLSEFRTGDCLISGIPAERRHWGAAMNSKRFVSRHQLFGPTWKADVSPPLGRMEQPFDYPQILRLKADAIREASGADVGVIWEHTPPWNRWGDSLPAGTVTLDDLATIDMFPEYIGVAEMTGADLLGLGKPSAWTVVAGSHDSAHDGKMHLAANEIDPGKTYRVAMGCFGIPYYGAEPSQMPKLFPFATPQDFLTVPSNRLPLRDFRQLPVQVIEATAQYIRHRGKVSPRPVCGDLTEYIINPQDNDFPACDWLHLGIETPQTAAVESRDRYTLNLGLRTIDEPEMVRSRDNSKHFLDLDKRLNEPETFRFSALDKRLPVTANFHCSEYTLTGKEPNEFQLAAAKAVENVVGECLLVNVRLSNAGLKDVTVTAVLSSSSLRKVWRQTWPDEEVNGSRGYYAGYHRAWGEDQQAPTHEDAALLLFTAPMPETTRLVVPNAGYDLGLAGISAPITLKASQTLSLPLLFVNVNRPRGNDISLAHILDTLKDDLMAKCE